MDLTLTRRALLGAFGAATAVGVLGVPTLTARGADIFDELRLRYRASLVGPDDLDLSDPVIAKEAAELGKEMDELVPLLDRSADRRGVFTDLNIFDDPDASRVTDTYKRLLPMATAWAVPGHHWSASTELADHLVEAMRWMNENVYTAGRPEYENWWDWELGSVSRIGKILVIAYDIIPEDLREAYADAVDWYVTPGYMYPRDSEKHKPATGSNLLNICLGAAIVAIVARRADRLVAVQTEAPKGLGFTDGSSRDGLHPDGSFVQHGNVAYMGTYGVSFLSAVADVVSLTGGSPWAIESPGMSELLAGIDAGVVPVVYDGLMMDFVSGREIAYSYRSEASRGAGAVFMLIRFAQGADEQRRRRWLAVAKGWIERSAYRDLSNPSSIGQVPWLQQATDPQVDATAEPDGAVMFPTVDRAVHRGPGWAVSISASSRRTARFEVTNYENLRPWHQGSGQVATYLTGDVDGQRSDGYWPTVDPFRLPGTTVDSIELPDIDQKSLRPDGFGTTAFSAVGAPVEDGGRQRGTFGAVYSDEQGYDSTMRVHQSWFLLEDGVVCLGAGIRGGAAAVETIVSNVRVPLGANPRWSADGRSLPGSGEAGFAQRLSRPEYLSLEGDSGYVFLERPRELHVIREDREGSWQRIKLSEDDVWVTRSYATAWIDHGTDPDGATYAYMLLPGADAAATARWARRPPVQVLRNDDVAQAVRARGSGYLGANFARAGRVRANEHELRADAPSSVSVLADRHRRTVEVALADAAWTGDPVTVTLQLPAARRYRPQAAQDGVQVQIGTREVTVTLAPGDGGQFRRVLLRRG